MNLIEQLKLRRKQLHLHQKDMQLRIGMNRQQYQRIESGGNPRLDTLDLIAKGLDSELVLVPNEYLDEVKRILENKPERFTENQHSKKLSDDPWQEVWG